MSVTKGGGLGGRRTRFGDVTSPRQLSYTRYFLHDLGLRIRESFYSGELVSGRSRTPLRFRLLRTDGQGYKTGELTLR